VKIDTIAALFLMLGQAAEKTVAAEEDIVPKESLLLSSSYDLAALVPDKVRRATEASEGYKLFFVFEEYLRELVVEVLTKDNGAKHGGISHRRMYGMRSLDLKQMKR
jgi:hypothetical protein